MRKFFHLFTVLYLSITPPPSAPLAQARAYLGVAVIHDQLYAIGGYDGSRWLNSVERYDPLRDQWTSGERVL